MGAVFKCESSLRNAGFVNRVLSALTGTQQQVAAAAAGGCRRKQSAATGRAQSGSFSPSVPGKPFSSCSCLKLPSCCVFTLHQQVCTVIRIKPPAD